MVNHTHYTYRIRWSEEDDQFVGLCTELPSLSWLHLGLTALRSWLHAGLAELVF